MKFSKRKGFTLIELLVVVAIIGILATIVLNALNSARAKARDARRESDIKTIQNTLEMYYVENGHYPSSQNIGGPYINTHHANSAYPSWQNLENILGVDLPEDPINELGNPSISPYAFNYDYFGGYPNPTYCNGQAYMLVYNKETSVGTGPNDGITFCSGLFFDYNDAFVVGMSPQQ